MKTLYMNAVIVLLCGVAACTSNVTLKESTLARQELQLASTFMTSIIDEDYHKAYSLFSNTVTRHYPYGLFATMQKQINDRLGTPVTYSFDRESSPDPYSVRITEMPSSGYIYSMRFKKSDKTRNVPVLITFERDESTARLLSCRFLMNESK